MKIEGIQGHWSRTWIKAPGFEDHTTRVDWMQSGTFYADVRIPLERPNIGARSSLSELSANELLLLSRAEGFAGTVSLEGNHCTWHRDINWHGQPDGLDIGAISFDDEGRMIEEGVESDYTELWETPGNKQTNTLVFGDNMQTGYLVTVGEAFVFGIGRAGAPSTEPVLAYLKKGQVPADAAKLFENAHAFGAWDGSHAIAHRATNPFYENRPIASKSAGSVTWHAIRFDGSKSDHAFKPIAGNT